MAGLKRLDPEQIARLDRLRHQRARHEVLRSLHRRAKRLNRQVQIDQRRSIAKRLGIQFDADLAREQIVLPSTFSFRDNYSETVRVLAAIRDIALREHRRMMLHLTHLKHVEPAAALALVAEIFRVRHLRSSQAITGNYPMDSTVDRLLDDMGFYKQLNVRKRPDLQKKNDDPSRPIFIRFLTSNKVESVLADGFVSVVEQHILSLNKVARGRLVAAIIEAMNNTLDHAHPTRVLNETMPRRWWLNAWVNVQDRETSVLLYDQGVGIPRTLEPTLYEVVRAAVSGIARLRLSSKPSDGEMIAAATELHRTGTGQGGRGKGFRNMKQFVDVCTDGELRVLSNRGSYSYMRTNETCGNEDTSLGGTLVEWRFRHDGTVELYDE